MSDFKNGCLCGKSSPYQGLCSPRLPLRHYNQEKRINNPVNIKKRLLWYHYQYYSFDKVYFSLDEEKITLLRETYNENIPTTLNSQPNLN